MNKQNFNLKSLTSMRSKNRRIASAACMLCCPESKARCSSEVYVPCTNGYVRASLTRTLHPFVHKKFTVPVCSYFDIGTTSAKNVTSRSPTLQQVTRVSIFQQAQGPSRKNWAATKPKKNTSKNSCKCS